MSFLKNIWFLNLVVKLSGVFRPLTLSSLLSILSLTVGVTTLLVAMSLVDSYEKSFKNSIYSVFSHVVVSPSYGSEPNLGKVQSDLSQAYEGPFQISESFKKEGLLAHKGKVSGVILEGVNTETISSVIDLESKVIQGAFVIDGPEAAKNPRVLIGKSLMENFNLKVGDVFSVVIPQPNLGGQSGFSRKIFNYSIGGVVDLGSHEYNKRFILMDIRLANLAGMKPEGFFSSVRVKLENPDKTDEFRDSLNSVFPEDYWVQTWKERSGGLLEAIKIERMVIFFLVLILVVVAAFNVSTNLYLNLAKRLKEFSVLQTIGMSKWQVSKFMVLNSVFLATFGVFFGLVLARLVIFGCNSLLKSGAFVPPEVYKLTSITIELSFSQFFVVSLATYLLCFLAALAPAKSVYTLSIVRGLRYE
jgi:lipoprotein-releasing system permease protein